MELDKQFEWIKWVDDISPWRDGLSIFELKKKKKKKQLRYGRWREEITFSDLIRSDRLVFRPAEMSWDLRLQGALHVVMGVSA